MFTAIMDVPYVRTSTLTKGRAYTVIDVNEYFGTYTIINDLGQRANVDWLRFRDMGHGYDAYKAEAA
jgi:hypothetical protein